MDDDLPGFGDVVGLRRLYRAAVERVRAMDIPEADRRAWLAELTRQYRAARGAETCHTFATVADENRPEPATPGSSRTP